VTDWSAIVWRKSSYCGNSTCVEVALLDTQVAVRDSKYEQGPVLLFSKVEWAAFLDGAKRGQFSSILD
jgi:Domain of unknown function (DUF397)